MPSNGGALANTVDVQGAVYRPGAIGWRSGLRVSDILGSAERDLIPVADLSYSLVIRVKNQLLDIEVIQFSLIDSLLDPRGPGDPVLEVGDQLLVFSAPDLEASAPKAYSRASLLEPVLTKLALHRDGEPRLTTSIKGAVKVPGEYPILPGYRVADLVRAAGGLKDSAFLDAAELRRITEIVRGEAVASYQEIDLGIVLASTEGPLLESRDILTVREIPDWSPNDTITVEGEVRFPGIYNIIKGERLSDVIARAGGLTEKAAPQAAIFTRESVAERQVERANEIALEIRQAFATRLLTEESTSHNLTDVVQIASALEASTSRGRLLIDLELR